MILLGVDEISDVGGWKVCKYLLDGSQTLNFRPESSLHFKKPAHFLENPTDIIANIILIHHDIVPHKTIHNLPDIFIRFHLILQRSIQEIDQIMITAEKLIVHKCD